MNANVDSSILDKIKKLIALRDNPGTPEEAANAAARINDLLLRYNLSMAEVDSHNPLKDQSRIEVHTFDLEAYQGRHDAGFGAKLLGVIARFNFCQVVLRPQRRHEYDQGLADLLGKPHNVEVCIYMLDYCKTHIVRMEKEHWGRYQGIEKRNTYRRGFYQGAVVAIAERLHAQQQETINNQASETNASVSSVSDQFAIILRKDNELIKEEMQKRYNNLRSGNNRRQLDSRDGKQSGYEAGKRLDFSKGIGGGKPSTRGLLN